SAPVAINKIAKNLRIQVIKQNAENDLSGFLLRDFDKKTALIGVNASHSLNRQRFTIAHEIGHFCLHNYEGVHFDGKNTGLQVHLRNDKSSEGTNIEEREANLFAAELLMPKMLLEKDLATVKEIYLLDEEDQSIKNLANKYQVSVRALTYRLANLSYIKL
ncbi:MAG: ImmA/IrrE family metallo-endopeptidase, partial [Acidobacteriota bacterium]|nr:ImmA/IrrE family metallo-endopeptidase [Acidobacteriota bacterium]